MPDLPSHLSLYFDGACEPRNPGGWATYGWLLMDEPRNELAKGHGVAVPPGPGATNNVAEYTALMRGLEWLAEQSWRGTLVLCGDSALVINQMASKWACNKPHLRQLKQRCLELLGQVSSDWSACWIPREQNEQADALSRLGYEEATGQPCPQRRKSC